MKTVIYARFSSALQNNRSIEDQVALCRERCEREGWEVAGVFTDYETRGSAGITESARPGINALLERVEAGGVDQVLAEATDRIARHQGDAYTIRERIEFAGARLFVLSIGEVNDIMGTVQGLFDANFSKNLGLKVKRGQAGTVRDKRHPAGLAFGYRKANRLDDDGDIVRGLRDIHVDQADVVRRIFAEIAAGQSPLAVANRLNAEGVPGPRGRIWQRSTIWGDSKRQNGLLRNELYVGILNHDRTSKRQNPKTRRTLIRPNDRGNWQSVDVPELRIVDQGTWDKVQAILADTMGKRPERQRRPKQLLSGLATCGCCGGGWILTDRSRWGCGRRKQGGSSICSNSRSVSTDQFESRVLSGLQSHMLDPDLVEIYVREYHNEHARRSAELSRTGDGLRRKHRDMAAKFERLLSAMAEGANEFPEVRTMLAAARDERDSLAAQIEALDNPPVVMLHPAIIADYREQVAHLNASLSDNPAARLEAIPKLRSLIDTITVIPAPDSAKGVAIEVTGRLQSMLALASGGVMEVRQGLTVERVKRINRYPNILTATV